MIEYECLQTVGKRTTRWSCTMELKRKQPPYELEPSARGHHFHILFGKHAYGNFLCIPNWDIGCDEYSNLIVHSVHYSIGIFTANWPTTVIPSGTPILILSRHMKKADAISVAQALAVIREYLN